MDGVTVLAKTTDTKFLQALMSQNLLYLHARLKRPRRKKKIAQSVVARMKDEDKDRQTDRQTTGEMAGSEV